MFGVDNNYQGYTYPGGYQQSRYNNQYGGYQNPFGQMNMQTPPVVQQPVPQVIKGRPVANIEEANAAQIDFDGSLFVFPNEANKKIYTKRIGLDGNPEFLTYVLEEKKPEQRKQVLEHVEGEYVSREEFDRVLKQINKRFDDIREESVYESNADDV